MRSDLQAEVASHSRRVAILRICLPSAAIALVAVLLLSPTGNLLNKELRSGQAGGELLEYSGRTAEGSFVRVALANFLEEDTLSMVQGVTASVRHQDGTEHEVEATTVKASRNKDHIDLEGKAVLNSLGEFLVQSDSFRISLEDSSLLSGGEVEFSFPGGVGNAGNMRITKKEPRSRAEGESWSLIEFTDGVEVNFVRQQDLDF